MPCDILHAMDIKELDILDGDASRHWYYRSKAKALERYLGAERFERILDVGAGSGFFSRHLLSTTDATEAVCVDLSYAKDWAEDVNGKPIRFCRKMPDYAPDLILMMDVLEHVDDDAALLRTYTDPAKPGTRVLITVPAFPFMWSGHDEFLEHKRRYTLSTIKPVILGQGLVIQRLSYFFGLVFPLAFAVRLLDTKSQSGLKPHPAFIDKTLEFLCTLELPFMRLNKLMGLSVFCLAKKP